ncbi:MAG: hypothetical protein O7D30_12310 [Rickettsia endosymbiont of Ixodes persulcatus]|nr:hypothetical protein [Rickettsia endosymbiont of Ixodes persulcatus]
MTQRLLPEKRKKHDVYGDPRVLASTELKIEKKEKEEKEGKKKKTII